MRMFVGMVLGCLLTVGAAYIHDSIATSAEAAGKDADASRPIVNWDVAARKWSYIETTAHTAWLKLQSVGSRPSTHGA